MSISDRGVAALDHVASGPEQTAGRDVRALLFIVGRMLAESSDVRFLARKWLADGLGWSSMATTDAVIRRLVESGVLVVVTDEPEGESLRQRHPDVKDGTRVVRLWHRVWSADRTDSGPQGPHRLWSGGTEFGPVRVHRLWSADSTDFGPQAGADRTEFGPQFRIRWHRLWSQSNTYASTPVRGTSNKPIRGDRAEVDHLERLIEAMAPESRSWNGNKLGPRNVTTHLALVRHGAPMRAPELAEALGVSLVNARRRVKELHRHGLAERPDGPGTGWVALDPRRHDPADCRVCTGNKSTIPPGSHSPATDPLPGVSTRETAVESVSVDSRTESEAPEIDEWMPCDGCGEYAEADCRCGDPLDDDGPVDLLADRPAPDAGAGVGSVDPIPGTDGVIGWSVSRAGEPVEVYSATELPPEAPEIVRPRVAGDRVNPISWSVVNGTTGRKAAQCPGSMDLPWEHILPDLVDSSAQDFDC